MKIYYNSIDYTIPSEVSTENSYETIRKQHDVLTLTGHLIVSNYIFMYTSGYEQQICSKYELIFISNH